MAEYKSYINALRQCAKEHENDNIPFANIRTTDLCNDTADLLERLENGINNAIEEMEINIKCNTDPNTGKVNIFGQGQIMMRDILKRNIGE